jgi:hypothetical protein
MPEITPDHPWSRARDAIYRRATLVKRGTMAPRQSWSGHGGRYEVCEVAPEDGSGYVVRATITQSVKMYGEFASRNVLTATGHFETVEECQAWARAWVKTKRASPAVP